MITLPKIEFQARRGGATVLPMVEKLKTRYPELAKRLQAAAKSRGVTIRDIQSTLRVTYEMARRYWIGVAKPRGPKLLALAELVALEPAELEYGPSNRTELKQDRAVYGALSREAHNVALAWLKLSPSKQQLYRDAIFRDAAVETIMPWIRQGRPGQESYERFEQSVERDYHQHLRQLKLKI